MKKPLDLAIRKEFANIKAPSNGYWERSLAAELRMVVFREGYLRRTWLPNHCGVRANEDADALVREAHPQGTAVSRDVPAFDQVHTVLAHAVQTMCPDPRVLSCLGLRPLPARISRVARCLLF